MAHWAIRVHLQYLDLYILNIYLCADAPHIHCSSGCDWLLRGLCASAALVPPLHAALDQKTKTKKLILRKGCELHPKRWHGQSLRWTDLAGVHRYQDQSSAPTWFWAFPPQAKRMHRPVQTISVMRRLLIIPCASDICASRRCTAAPPVDSQLTQACRSARRKAIHLLLRASL